MLALPNRLSSFVARLDKYLLLVTALLLLFGVLVVWSTDHDLAHKQTQFAAVGVLLLVLAALLNSKYLQLLSPAIAALSLAMLVGVGLFGTSVRGSSRWLSLGPLLFQPSEFAKLGLVVGLSWLFCQTGLTTLAKFLGSLLVLGIFGALVFLQPDLGTGLIFVALWAGVAFMAEVPLAYLLGLALCGISSLPLVWGFLKDYQRQRIYSFINPRSDPLGSGYNVLQAIIAVGSGQIFGRGFGRGPQSQLRFLPERGTDFIFASLSEEWGLLGVTILLVLYFVLLWRILAVARKASDQFGALVCIGVFFMLLAQIFVNIGMNLGIMPITGLPLPLVSAGGSSLIVTLISLGVVESVASHREV